MSKLIFHCLLFAIPHIPLRLLQYFFFLQLFLPHPFIFFFKPAHDLVMFWIRIHMYSTAEKSSLTNRRCWAQHAGNWAASPWRVLSAVEMDGLMDRRRWSVFFLCAEEPLCKWARRGQKIAPVPLRSHSTRSPPCPGPLCVKRSVQTLSFFRLSLSIFPSVA